MWMISKYGFASVVEHKDQPGCVLVRGRDRGDLEEFCEVARDFDVRGGRALWHETIYRRRLCPAGELASLKIGKHHRYRRFEVKAWLDVQSAPNPYR